jgi:hypothetical protein
MPLDFSKLEKQQIRKLADLAWERQLRTALEVVGQSISQMTNNQKSAFDVADEIHRYHVGVAQDLYKIFSPLLPWFGVLRAYCDRVITNEDVADISDRLKAELFRHAEMFQQFDRQDSARSQPERETN